MDCIDLTEQKVDSLKYEQKSRPPAKAALGYIRHVDVCTLTYGIDLILSRTFACYDLNRVFCSVVCFVV